MRFSIDMEYIHMLPAAFGATLVDLFLILQLYMTNQNIFGLDITKIS